MCALRRGNDYPLAVYFRGGFNDSSDRVRLRDKYSMALRSLSVILAPER